MKLLAILLILVTRNVTAYERWMPLGKGIYANQNGDIAIPLDKDRGTYLLPDGRTLMRHGDSAVSSKGTSYLNSGGIINGSDGSVGVVAPDGDIFLFDDE